MKIFIGEDIYPKICIRKSLKAPQETVVVAQVFQSQLTKLGNPQGQNLAEVQVCQDFLQMHTFM